MFKGLGLTSTPSSGFQLERTREVSDPVIEGYEILTQMELQACDIIHDHVYSTYTGIRESSNVIVMEGLGDMLTGAARFFKELIKKLGEFFKKASMYMASLFMNFENFIERYKDAILKSEKRYSVYGFEYDFSYKVPQTDTLMRIVTEFNNEINDVTKMEKDELVKRRDAFVEEGYMDSLRGAILGKTSKIEASDFRDTLFKMFRSGQDVEREIRVDKGTLVRYMNDYSKLKREFEEVKKERFKLEKVYNSLETFFARGAKVEYVGQEKKIRTQTIDVNLKDKKFSAGDYTNNEKTDKNLDKINYYYSFKLKQAQEISSYSFQAYIERINALKEAVKFSEKVIRAAIFASPVEKGDEA